MKYEEQPRSGVDSKLVTEVLLPDGYWHSVRNNSFAIWSPVESSHRARNGVAAGAYLRFQHDETGNWIEAPLSSMVAVAYHQEDIDEPKS